jgi:hypothetical protein
MVEVHSSTVTVAVPAGSGMPGFIRRLPPTFQTQGALMLLAGATVAAGITIVWVVLSLEHVL